MGVSCIFYEGEMIILSHSFFLSQMDELVRRCEALKLGAVQEQKNPCTYRAEKSFPCFWTENNQYYGIFCPNIPQCLKIRSCSLFMDFELNKSRRIPLNLNFLASLVSGLGVNEYSFSFFEYKNYSSNSHNLQNFQKKILQELLESKRLFI